MDDGWVVCIDMSLILISGTVSMAVDRIHAVSVRLDSRVRRSVRFGKKIHIDRSFMGGALDMIADIYQKQYPELQDRISFIKTNLLTEEDNFRETLENGLKEFKKLTTDDFLSADEAFFLYETFGFPYELLAEEAKNLNIIMPRSFQKPPLQRKLPFRRDNVRLSHKSLYQERRRYLHPGVSPNRVWASIPCA